ncbi:MAG: LysR family transcriptional regulator [Neisseriaceae bacterium]|nr:LysR family transcriptional regulator [Neisseriaceae bacterium]
MSLNLAGITVFVAAVDAGSFAQAATRLHLSRSAVGKTIARLEDQLKVTLFHRTTRSLNLTEAGSLYYEHCLRALAELNTAQALIEQEQAEVHGQLRVSMPVLFGRLCVAPLLLDLAQAHPKLTLTLSFNDRLVDLNEDGFDLVIRHRGLEHSRHLVARPIASYAMVLCAAPAYLAKHGHPADLAQLAQHEALMYRRGHQDSPWFNGLGPPLTPRFYFDDIQAIADAACAGLGIAYLPDWLVSQALNSGQLCRLTLPVPKARPDAFQVHALWQANPNLPLKIRVAVDHLVAQLPPRLQQT